MQIFLFMCMLCCTMKWIILSEYFYAGFTNHVFSFAEDGPLVLLLSSWSISSLFISSYWCIPIPYPQVIFIHRVFCFSAKLVWLLHYVSVHNINKAIDTVIPNLTSALVDTPLQSSVFTFSCLFVSDQLYI